jgi:hypothetical protein
MDLMVEFIKQLSRPPFSNANSRMVEAVNKMTCLVADEKIFCENKSYLEKFVDTHKSFNENDLKYSKAKNHLEKRGIRKII